MKSKPYHLASARYLLLAITVLVVASAALALGGENISRWAVAGGGGQSVGGGYALHGTLGQTEAGPTMSGGDYTLSGGFWRSGITALPGIPVTGGNTIYMPLIER